MTDSPFYRHDELESLLTALDDLDDEFDAGDMSDEDYQTLKGDYTVRVADTMRRLERAEDKTMPDASTMSSSKMASSKTTASGSEPSGPSTARRVATWSAILVFAAGVGVLLAQAAGERGVNDTLTGSIGFSSRQRIQQCQEQAAAGGDLLGALECLDSVLEEDPENVEALSYRAWFLVLAAGGSPNADDDQAVELFDSAQIYLDQAIDIDPTYADARAFRAVIHDRRGDAAAACADIEALLASDPPPFFIDQTRPISDRNGCS